MFLNSGLYEHNYDLLFSFRYHSFLLFLDRLYLSIAGNHMSAIYTRTFLLNFSLSSMQAFFQRWWRDQSEAVQDLVRKFVSSGQLEFM